MFRNEGPDLMWLAVGSFDVAILSSVDTLALLVCHLMLTQLFVPADFVLQA